MTRVPEEFLSVDRKAFLGTPNEMFGVCRIAAAWRRFNAEGMIVRECLSERGRGNLMFSLSFRPPSECSSAPKGKKLVQRSCESWPLYAKCKRAREFVHRLKKNDTNGPFKGFQCLEDKNILKYIDLKGRDL